VCVCVCVCVWRHSRVGHPDATDLLIAEMFPFSLTKPKVSVLAKGNESILIASILKPCMCTCEKSKITRAKVVCVESTYHKPEVRNVYNDAVARRM